jgi:hypothetical protein
MLRICPVLDRGLPDGMSANAELGTSRLTEEAMHWPQGIGGP